MDTADQEDRMAWPERELEGIRRRLEALESDQAVDQPAAETAGEG
jgi:hypothetical protein